METVLRRLRLKRGDSQESDARKRLQKELFGFAAVCQNFCSYVLDLKFILHDKMFVYVNLMLLLNCLKYVGQSIESMLVTERWHSWLQQFTRISG